LERLASKREENGQESLALLERAATLDPQSPERQMRAALRAEMAGRLTLAEDRLLRAAALSRLYQPRFLLAQYYCRRGKTQDLETWSRAALKPAYGDVSSLLQLCWRARPDGSMVSQLALAEKPEIVRQCLALLVAHELTDAAYPVASHLAELAREQDLAALLGFCNLSLSRDRKREALEVWNRLCRKGLLPYHVVEAAPNSLLTNSDFARTPLAAGFDWHFEPAPWLRSATFGDGVRVELTGLQPEQCLIAWQYVPTCPGQRYRLEWESRTGTSDPDGLIWVPFDLRGKAIAAPRADYSEVFTATGQLLRLALMYQRPAGSPRLRGAARVKWVSLEAAP